MEILVSTAKLLHLAGWLHNGWRKREMGRRRLLVKDVFFMLERREKDELIGITYLLIRWDAMGWISDSLFWHKVKSHRN